MNRAMISTEAWKNLQAIVLVKRIRVGLVILYCDENHIILKQGTSQHELQRYDNIIFGK